MVTITRRAALATPLLAVPALARAQAWRPPGQTRIIVPAAAGGTTDIMARLVAQYLQARWGTPVVVDNRAGAGGTIGTVEAVRARPDGTTLLLGNIGPQAIGYSLFRNLPYRAEQTRADRRHHPRSQRAGGAPLGAGQYRRRTRRPAAGAAGRDPLCLDRCRAIDASLAGAGCCS